MGNIVAKPSLGFVESVRKVMANLTNFSGRSRRSEFWWFMLAFIIGVYCLQFILTIFMSTAAESILATLLWFLPLSVTARRLQDRGHSKWWVIVSWIASLTLSIGMMQTGFYDLLTQVNVNPKDLAAAFSSPLITLSSLVGTVTGIAIFVFCLLDGKPEPNKYGDSPKYFVEEDATQQL